MHITVKTQQELDTALKDSATTLIYIKGRRGDWLRLSVPSGREVSVVARENSSVVARENSSVEAWENSSVEAWGNSSVVAWGNSSVVARGNSSVVARENSSVVAWGNSSVEAWENSSVVAWENSSVVARENSSVVARENSSVVARENSSVEARGNSSVEARENSSVEARGNSSVEARHTARLALFGQVTAKAAPLVSVHIHDPRATATGGHQIIVPPIHTVREWAEYHGLEIGADGELTVFKAVNSDLTSPHGALYAIGQEVEAADWSAKDCCGLGLHFSATPREAMRYHSGAKRFLACRIHVDETVVIGQGERGQDKVKSRRCLVLHEVDVKGRPLEAVTK